MRKPVKICLLSILVFLGLIFILLGGSLLYLQTDHGQAIIQRKINGLIPGSISWEKSHLSPLKGEFNFQNLSLKGPLDEDLAGLERVSVTLSWMSLLKGELTVEELIAEKPWAALRLDEEGELNFVRALARSKEGGPGEGEGGKEGKGIGVPFNMAITSLKLVDGAISYEMVQKGLKIEAKEISFTAHGDLLKRTGHIDIQIGRGRIDGPGAHVTLAGCKMSGSLSRSGIELHSLDLTTSSSKVTASGEIRDILRKPLFDLALDTTVSLAEARESLHVAVPLTGEVAVKSALKGSLDNPEVSLRLDYGGGVVSGISIDRANLNLYLKDRLLTVKKAEAGIASGDIALQGEIDLHHAFANGFLAAHRNIEEISYDVLLKGQGIALERLPHPVSNKVRGTMSYGLALCGKGLSFRSLSANAVLEMVVKGLSAGELRAPDDLFVRTKADLEGGVATFKGLEAKAGDIVLWADGQLDLPSRQITVNLSLEAASLEKALLFLGLDDFSGECKVNGRASGSIKNPTLALFIQGDRLRYKEISIGSVRLSANLDQRGRLDIPGITVENRGSLIKGKGFIKPFKDSILIIDPEPELRFTTTLYNVELRDFMKIDLPSGMLEGKVDLEGTFKSLEATGSLKGKDVAFDRVRVGDLVADLRFSRGRLFINRMDVRKNTSMLHVSGAGQFLYQNTMKPLKDPTYALKIQGDSIFIEDFVDGVKGKLALDATLEGSVRKPRGTIDLHGTDVDLGVQRFHEMKLVCTLDGKRARFKPLQLVVAPGESIEAVGWITMDKAYQIELVSKGISLANIEKIREREIGEGRVLFNISGHGTLENPRLTGEIALENPKFKGRSFDDFRVQLDLRDQVAHISGRLNFDLKGSLHVKKGDFSAFIQCHRTDLEPYFRLMDRKHLSAAVSGRIEARGNARAFRQTYVVADLSYMELLYKEVELFAGRVLKAEMEDGEITIHSLRGSLLKEGKIDIKGKAKVHGSLSLQAEGTIPLQVARLFVDELPDITGNASISASVAGSWSHPDIRGEMKLKDVGFRIPSIGQVIHDLSATIRITPQMVTIDTLEGRMDTGRFSAAGTMELKGIRPAGVDLAIDAYGIFLQVPDMLDVLLNATLRIQGTPDKSLVQGEIVILEGTYYKDVNLSLLQVVGERKRQEAPRPREITLPFMKDMSVDISLRRRNPFVVDNNLAHLDINPDLRISGTLSNPILTGRAAIEGGTITYRRRTFNVKKGEIDFSDPYKIEPIFDIEGEVQVRKWTILLAISGPPDKLSLTLTSDPPEEDGDILSLLLFGRTTHELIEAEGGTTKSTTRMLAGILATTLEDDIKKATGLDILEVETQAQEEEQVSDQLKVTIGKELSRRMTLKYAVESKDGELSQRAIAEYKLLEGILLSGFQDDKGTSGGEILFRLEFR
jgi:translocation and assembly module TamB